MKKSKIYTATGDKGTTSLVGGQRVKKCDDRLEAYGTVDELNSFIGLLASKMNKEDEERKILLFIQNKLFNIGAYLATDNSEDGNTGVYGFGPADIEKVECAIDNFDSQVEPLCKFLLPGGGELASLSQVCRTVARRCERRIIALGEHSVVSEDVVKFVNRLSDLFFVLARYLTKKEGESEIFWEKD